VFGGADASKAPAFQLLGNVLTPSEPKEVSMMAVRFVAVVSVLALTAWCAPAMAQDQSQQQGMQQPAGKHPAVDAGSIVGTKVRTADGKDLGKVDRVMIDPSSGKVDSLMISAGGGVLGGGGKNVSVPWDQVKIARDGDKQDLVVVVQQQLLEQAPAASPATGNDQQNKDQNQKKQ
jgi:sporulation protein YlmC with PRC-barrel domain